MFWININCLFISRFWMWCEALGPQCIFSLVQYVYATHMLVDSMNIQVLVYIKEE